LGIHLNLAPIVEKAGVEGAVAIAIAAATFGLVAGSLIGGPVGNFLIKKYAHDGEYLVEWDKDLLKKKHYYASGKRLIADTVWVNKNSGSDPLAAQRSLIRHDADRVARELMRIYFA